MADYAVYVALVAKALEDDNTLRGLVDGQIIPGFRRTDADRYLQKANHCCVGVRFLNLNSQGLPGCAYHGMSDHDQLIEFHLVRLGTDDVYLGKVSHQIQQIMKKPISKTMHGIAYSVSTTGPVKFMPVDDDQFVDRVQVTGTAKLKFLDE